MLTALGIKDTGVYLSLCFDASVRWGQFLVFLEQSVCPFPAIVICESVRH